MEDSGKEEHPEKGGHFVRCPETTGEKSRR